MATSNRGFGSNPALARKVGKVGGAKSKGRVLSPEHKAKISAALKRNHGSKTY